jgi:aryl-alcohol dehydrogenase-like predicted oxidoreductase
MGNILCRVRYLRLRVIHHSQCEPEHKLLTPAQEASTAQTVSLRFHAATCLQNLFNLADQRWSELLDDSTRRGIAFVPFVPLGRPRGAQNAILRNPVLDDLSRTLGATPAWLLDLSPNVLLTPGTRTRQHLSENIRSASVVAFVVATVVLPVNCAPV